MVSRSRNGTLGMRKMGSLWCWAIIIVLLPQNHLLFPWRLCLCLCSSWRPKPVARVSNHKRVRPRRRRADPYCRTNTLCKYAAELSIPLCSFLLPGQATGGGDASIPSQLGLFEQTAMPSS